MPTRGRPQYAQRAIECFFSQTWPEKELVILDDADCPSFPIAPAGVEYHRLNRRLSIGAKRNLCCSRANGNVIIHWDDDDYSVPERMADQVARLAESKCGLTGYHSMLFEDVDTGKRWKYRGHHFYALGTSFCYTRDFWMAHPFPDKQTGEDGYITSRVAGILAVDAGELLIATIHNGNTSEKRANLNTENWVAA